MLIIIVSNNLCVAGRTDWWMLKLGILFDPEMEFFNVACVFYPVHSGLCLRVLRLHLQIHRSTFSPPLNIPNLTTWALRCSLSHTLSSVCTFGSEWARLSPISYLTDLCGPADLR